MDEVKKRSFAAGYLMGLAGMPVAAAPVQFPAEPTMCLYGGTPLPYLAWDKKTYHRALVTYNFQTGEFRLAVYKESDYYQVEAPTLSGTYTQYWFGSENESTALVFSCKAGDTRWLQLDETCYGVNLSRGSVFKYHTYPRVIWANFDLLFDNGTMYVGRSAPEPVRNPSDFNGKSYYGFVALPHFGKASDWHYLALMKHPTQDAYVMFDIMGGNFKYGNYEVYFQVSPNTGTARLYPTDGSPSQSVDIMDYVEQRQEGSQTKYYIGQFENLIWVDEALSYNEGDPLPSDPIPVVIPESKPGATTDNKLFVLGCRLGYIIRSQMGKGNAETDIPVGVLISSDGYILRDCNGVYLIAKEDA